MKKYSPFFLAILFMAITIELSAENKYKSDRLNDDNRINHFGIVHNQTNKNKIQAFNSKDSIGQIHLTDPITPIYTIPVVVHVLYSASTENIPDQQILDGIEVLNKDFQLRNENANQCPNQWKYLQANCQIEFCLASITRKDVGSQQFKKPVYSDILTHGKIQFFP